MFQEEKNDLMEEVFLNAACVKWSCIYMLIIFHN